MSKTPVKIDIGGVYSEPVVAALRFHSIDVPKGVPVIQAAGA